MSIAAPDNSSPDAALHTAPGNGGALRRWLATEQGRYVMAWEQRKIAPLVSDAFGFNAIQIGLPEIDFLEGNRIPLKIRLGDIQQLVTPGSNLAPALDRIDLVCELPELPFAANSIDLVVLTHALEFHAHPHLLLREVERVLIPEGKLVIAGFNPYSLWGLRRRMPRCSADGPWEGRFISLPRIKDWMTLLNMEIDRGHFGCYAPPFGRSEWLTRFGWMEKAGDRWWPVGAGVYLIRAVKRVYGMRLIKPNWKTATARRKIFSPAVRKLRPHD
jgi:SAM-dependent methyltransferase